jgi:quercetin dioxygenase-like cupin family protein
LKVGFSCKWVAKPPNDFCVLKGTILPGASVPLHSHADTEDFLVISGSVEGLRHDTGGYTWTEAKAGDYVHVPGGAQHAWRNTSGEAVITLIITTKRIGQFFREVGRPATGTPQTPTPEDLERFAGQIGADAYASDAVAGVKRIKELVVR